MGRAQPLQALAEHLVCIFLVERQMVALRVGAQRAAMAEPGAKVVDPGAQDGAVSSPYSSSVGGNRAGVMPSARLASSIRPS